jgi:hypothetical protein
MNFIEEEKSTIEMIATSPAVGRMLNCPYIGTNYCMSICQEWADSGLPICNFCCTGCHHYRHGCPCTRLNLPRAITIHPDPRYPGIPTSPAWLLYDPNSSITRATDAFHELFGISPKQNLFVESLGIYILGPCPPNPTTLKP